VQQANARLHALYTLDNGTVTLDNLGATSEAGLSIESKVYSLAGDLLDDQQASNITLASQEVANAVLTPAVPAPTTAPTPARTYFVELLLRQNGTIVDRNVYWSSTQQDVTNWSQTLGQPQATLSQYANLQALKTLPRASIAASATTTRQPGPNGADLATTVTITNNSASPTVGFFLRADVRRGTAAGTEIAGDNELQSSIWNDNDVTLWPGESETLTATYQSADLQGNTPVISVSGWNLPKIDIAAPAP